MNSLEVINQTSKLLSISTTPRLDVEILLAHVLNLSRTQLIIDGRRNITSKEYKSFMDLVEKRNQGLPVAYLLGSKEFWGLEFKVSPAVLVPRPETEHLVERTLEIIKDSPLSKIKILELGTGTGCIAISLASELQKSKVEFEILAVDFSNEALNVAKENYQKLISSLPVRFIHSNWFQSVEVQKFDLIISNPPYVNADLPDLSPELRYEPASALYSSNLGLADIFEIIQNTPRYLSSQGTLLIEIGSEQRALLEDHLRSINAQAKIDFIQDLAGMDRIIEIKFT